jgi:hypothetical protein
LILDGSDELGATKLLLGDLTVSSSTDVTGTLTVKDGATFDIETFEVEVTNDSLIVEANARLTIGGAANMNVFPEAKLDLQKESTVEYDLIGAQTIAPFTYYHIDLTGGGTKDISAGSAGAKGVVDVEDGADFNVGTTGSNYFTFISVGEGANKTGILDNLYDEGAIGTVTGDRFEVQRWMKLTSPSSNIFGWNDWATLLKTQLVRNWKYQNGWDIFMAGFPDSHQPWSIFKSVVTYSTIEAAANSSKNKGWKTVDDIDQEITYEKGIRLWYGNYDRNITVKGSLNQGEMEYNNLEYTLCSDCASTNPSLGTDSVQSGWNLVGNPYVAPINFQKIYDGTGGSMSFLDPAYWFVGQMYGTYTYNAETGSSNYSSLDSLIYSHKGFWVKATGLGALAMSINEYAKDTTGVIFFKANENKRVIKLALKNPSNGFTSGLAVVMLNSADDKKDKYDNDLMKHYNADFPTIYALTSDNKKVMIDGIANTSTSVKIGMEVPVSGVYELDVAQLVNIDDLSCLYLQDLFTNEIHDLRSANNFLLNLSDTTSVPQFQLVFTEGPLLSHEMKKVGCSANNDGQLTFFLGSNSDAVFTLTDTAGNVINTVTQSSTATFTNLAPGTYRMYITGDAVPCATGYQEYIVEKEEATIALYESTSNELDLAFDNPEVSFTNESTNGAQQQWFINGVMVASSVDLHHSFTQSGVYEVTLMTLNEQANCIDAYSETITVNNNTGIDELASQNIASIVVSKDQIMISNINTKHFSQIRLLSSDGKTLNEVTFVDKSLSITTQDLNSGIYLLEFSGDSKQEIVKLFIK